MRGASESLADPSNPSDKISDPCDDSIAFLTSHALPNTKQGHAHGAAGLDAGPAGGRGLGLRGGVVGAGAAAQGGDGGGLCGPGN